MMKKLSVFLLTLISFLAFSQIGTSLPSTKIGGENSKWTFGGYAGINGGFWGSGFGVNISPRVGYKIYENFEAGISAGFNWQNSSYASSTLLGIGPFANYYFGRSFFIGTQFQEYIITQKIKSTGEKVGFDEAALYLGGGYLQKLGANSYMQIGGMYNVLWKKDKSIFGSGFVPNIGIVFGL